MCGTGGVEGVFNPTAAKKLSWVLEGSGDKEGQGGVCFFVAPEKQAFLDKESRRRAR